MAALFLIINSTLTTGLIVENGTNIRYGNSSFNVSYNFTSNITFVDNLTIYSRGVLIDDLDNVSLLPNASSINLVVLSWNATSHVNNFTITGNNNSLAYQISVNGTPGFVYYNYTFQNQNFTVLDTPLNFFYNTTCQESWSCTTWLDVVFDRMECISGEKDRTCTDANACGTEVNKPAEHMWCTPSGGVGGGGGVTPVYSEEGEAEGEEETETEAETEVKLLDLSNRKRLILAFVVIIILLGATSFFVVAFLKKKKKKK